MTKKISVELTEEQLEAIKKAGFLPEKKKSVYDLKDGDTYWVVFNNFTCKEKF